MTLTLLVFLAGTAHADLKIFLAGHPADVHPKLHGPVLDLAGSSAEPAALQAMVDAVRGCSDCDTTLDVVVIRASGDQGLNEVFMKLKGVDSSQTFVITDRDSANRRDFNRAVRNAEIVWFAGGDQCNYIRWIKGTPVQRSVERVFKRGGGVGGNSAGLAIQGEIAYDACPDVSAVSKDVLADPFSRDVSLSTNFFRWPAVHDLITDTHFHQRDRFGRLVVFLARSRAPWGLGVDEQTSVIVTPDLKGRVYGPGAAYLLRNDHPAGVLERGKPLTYRGLKVWKFVAGDTIDFARRPVTGYRTLDVVDGKLSADPY
ncbi:MAG TPA: cyanophycinase [Thermoanaerobaculia bacterium]|nr:cyanophycinase [Thermoanaerobaculia bacterium]